MKYNISVIIPAQNRHEITCWHLRELCHQALGNFQVIVVDDRSDIPLEDYRWKYYSSIEYNYDLQFLTSDGIGPNAARNMGANFASSDTLLFVGNDAIPDRNLLFRHYYTHQSSQEKIAVQGYSPFHPQVMSTEFMYYLDKSGKQANWQALKDGQKWKRDVTSFCLTTNFSIDSKIFWEQSGFDIENFPAPAWDDIHFGYQLKKYGIKTILDPYAVNLHYHSYDLRSFIKRQTMVGRNLWNLVLAAPEFSAGMIKPDELRFARKEELAEWIHVADSIKYTSNNIPDIQDRRFAAWDQVLHLAMLKGQLEELDKRGRFWRVFEHLHKAQDIAYALEAINGVKMGNWGFAQHAIGWILQNTSDNWAVHCLCGEIELAFGNTEEASKYFRKSLEIAPNEWAQERLLQNDC